MVYFLGFCYTYRRQDVRTVMIILSLAEKHDRMFFCCGLLMLAYLTDLTKLDWHNLSPMMPHYL